MTKLLCSQRSHMEERMNLRSLFEHTHHVQELPSGATLFAEGTTGEVMYVILEGEVEVRMRHEVVEVLGPGEIVGEMALIKPQPRTATVVARSDCRLAVIDEKRFLYMVSDTPFFSLHVMRVLVERLQRSMGRNE